MSQYLVGVVALLGGGEQVEYLQPRLQDRSQVLNTDGISIEY